MRLAAAKKFLEIKILKNKFLKISFVDKITADKSHTTYPIVKSVMDFEAKDLNNY